MDSNSKVFMLTLIGQIKKIIFCTFEYFVSLWIFSPFLHVNLSVRLNLKVMICIVTSFGFSCGSGRPLTAKSVLRDLHGLICLAQCIFSYLGEASSKSNRALFAPQLLTQHSCRLWEMKMSHGTELHLTAKGYPLNINENPWRAKTSEKTFWVRHLLAVNSNKSRMSLAS